jgi:hypothetical protein
MAPRAHTGSVRARLSLLVVAVACLSACATIFGPPEESPPEAPSARIMRTLSPSMRNQMWPPVFDSREYVERLICPAGDWITAKRLSKKGLVETYEIDCPGEKPLALNVDIGYEPPPPPDGFRLLEAASFVKYHEAFAALEKKDFEGASRLLDEAIKIAPKETIYRRDRVFLLFQMGLISDAFLQADQLVAEQASPTLYKYRALAARELGLRSEVMSSLEGMLRTSRVGHPLYAEAICAKGMILSSEGDAQAERLMTQGCSLEYKPCCEALQSLHPQPPDGSTPQRSIDLSQSTSSQPRSAEKPVSPAQ